ncbi:YicC family protein [Catenovulum sp. SM1970]|uniref:YicC/YloC family endoribonuclease n=1 Tax=Marinifaba aquimaris TaxID=2741323 RepID=UPI001571DFA9|nr:YicC/YloC family endoribonuclease [Marinifaba aquimaris]NTS77483.1 YicC family protein [Marinifaba aquimaris]
MAIHSMTAFARLEKKGNFGSAVWELRSVNQRYLENFFRLPESQRSLEPVLREKIRKSMQRGKLECSLKLSSDGAEQGKLLVNQDLAKQVIEAANWVKAEASSGDINPIDVLRWPGVMSAEEQDLDALKAELITQFDQLIKDFIDARASEGETLRKLIEQRLTAIGEQVVVVRNAMPEILKWQREKLQTKLDELNAEIDQNRLEQELIYQAQKVDVAEELDRLESHIKETQAILKKGGACGRRLDFMMQEFNREANTLASKSINAEITNAAVEVKVLIEQMREQIQNIE